MSWDPLAVTDSLTSISTKFFTGFSTAVALSGTGQYTDPPATGSFSYDDTQWGAVPEGITTRLAACAAQAPGVIGTRVLIFFQPIFALNNIEGSLSQPGSGEITAFSARMEGQGGSLDTADVNASVAADRAVGLADALPFTVGPGHLNRPSLFLLRPESLVASDNEAERILWSPWELGIFHWSFTVSTPEVTVANALQVTGYE